MKYRKVISNDFYDLLSSENNAAKGDEYKSEIISAFRVKSYVLK